MTMMKKKRFLLALLFIGLLAFVSVAQAQANANSQLQNPRNSVVRTLRILSSTPASPLNNSELNQILADLNAAVSDMSMANSSTVAGNLTQANRYSVGAATIAAEAEQRAGVFSDSVKTRSFVISLTAIGLVPILSLLVTIGTLFLMRWYSQREDEKLLRMSITKGDAKHD